MDVGHLLEAFKWYVMDALLYYHQQVHINMLCSRSDTHCKLSCEKKKKLFLEIISHKRKMWDSIAIFTLICQ